MSTLGIVLAVILCTAAICVILLVCVYAICSELVNLTEAIKNSNKDKEG